MMDTVEAFPSMQVTRKPDHEPLPQRGMEMKGTASLPAQ
jgi:hypothetical protein